MTVTETKFDTQRHHIHLDIIVYNNKGVEYSVDAILDTGAPTTEFSDSFLYFIRFVDSIDSAITTKPGLQSQKYNRIVLPEIVICGHTINNYNVCVSHFQDSWGVDALIGLDFFRMFQIKIEYSRGVITASPFIH